MAIAGGIALILLSVLCWGGQTISLLAPRVAEKLSLTEAAESVDPAFHADGRGEALWDALTLWVMVVAGILLLVDHPAWPYFGLAGGAMYVYFAGRGVAARRAMQARGLRIGSRQTVTTAYVFLTIWGVMGLATVYAATATLA